MRSFLESGPYFQQNVNSAFTSPLGRPPIGASPPEWPDNITASMRYFLLNLQRQQQNVANNAELLTLLQMLLQNRGSQFHHGVSTSSVPPQFLPFENSNNNNNTTAFLLGLLQNSIYNNINNKQQATTSDFLLSDKASPPFYNNNSPPLQYLNPPGVSSWSYSNMFFGQKPQSPVESLAASSLGGSLASIPSAQIHTVVSPQQQNTSLILSSKQESSSPTAAVDDIDKQPGKVQRKRPIAKISKAAAEESNLMLNSQQNTTTTTTALEATRPKHSYIKRSKKRKRMDSVTNSPVSGMFIRESCDVKMATVNELDDSAPYVEISAESREAIASIPNVIGAPICFLCKTRYEDVFKLAMHRCPRIGYVEHRCVECDKTFPCPANLASHLRWHKHNQKSRKERTSANESDGGVTRRTFPLPGAAAEDTKQIVMVAGV